MNYQIKYNEINDLVNECSSSLEELAFSVQDFSNSYVRLLDGQRSDEFIGVIQNQMEELSSSLSQITDTSFAELLSNLKVISDSFEQIDEGLKQ